MDMSGFTGSNYITAEYLELLGPNVRIETTIASSGLRSFDDGDKPVIFVDYQGKAIVLNPTRAKVLCAAFGIHSENWTGKQIIVFRGETTYSGKKVGCVEIEAVGGERLGAEQRPALGPKRTWDGPAPTDSAPLHDRAPDGPDDNSIPF